MSACLRMLLVQYERGESVLEENGGVGAIMEMDLPSNKALSLFLSAWIGVV